MEIMPIDGTAPTAYHSPAIDVMDEDTRSRTAGSDAGATGSKRARGQVMYV